MSGLNKEFNEWWDSGDEWIDNPFDSETPMFWAWEGWHAGVKAEREACAKVCEDLVNTDPEWTDSSYWDQGIERCAYAIRARGQE